MPERKSDHTGFPDMPPSAMSKTEMWKNKLERKSRAIDKELGFENVTAESADEWLNARMIHMAQESHRRTEASWVQLQAGLEFQRRMSRGVLPSSKETPPPSETGGARSRPTATMATRAARRNSPDQDETEIPSVSRSRRGSPGAAKQQKTRSQPLGSSTAQANDDGNEGQDADASSGRQQPTTKRGSSRSQNKETVLEQEESQGQAHPRKRPRADPLDTNLGPGWDFHLVRGNRPTKIRGNGYTT